MKIPYRYKDADLIIKMSLDGFKHEDYISVNDILQHPEEENYVQENVKEMVNDLLKIRGFPNNYVEQITINSQTYLCCEGRFYIRMGFSGFKDEDNKDTMWVERVISNADIQRFKYLHNIDLLGKYVEEMLEQLIRLRETNQHEEFVRRLEKEKKEKEKCKESTSRLRRFMRNILKGLSGKKKI